jgi:hypothetical protein
MWLNLPVCAPRRSGSNTTLQLIASPQAQIARLGGAVARSAAASFVADGDLTGNGNRGTDRWAQVLWRSRR